MWCKSQGQTIRFTPTQQCSISYALRQYAFNSTLVLVMYLSQMDNASSGMDLITIMHVPMHHMYTTANESSYLNFLFNGNHMGYDVSTHLFAPALTACLLKDLFAPLVFEQDLRTLASWEES
jgi:hypothetical protein